MKIIKAKVWRKIDIQINSKIKYDNPYKDIDIIVTFIHESNKIIKLNAFFAFSTVVQYAKVKPSKSSTPTINHNFIHTFLSKNNSLVILLS